MNYDYHDLRYQAEGNHITVDLGGAAARVLLLDPTAFIRYRNGGRDFYYEAGRFYDYHPAEIRIPRNGVWYIVIESGDIGKQINSTVIVTKRPP